MGLFHSERLNERRRGLKFIEGLAQSKDKSLIIHYSCESFFNTHGRTPRITSICVKNRSNNSTTTFSIHIQAQISKKDLCCLTDQDYDDLEYQMLKQFFTYLKKHKTYRWIHWNMRNASYGFEAISNRYKILGGSSFTIEDQFKFNLPEILGLIYTYKFEKHEPNGQLLNLAGRNHISARDALTGKLEADAFDNKDYLGLHMSTSRKVEVIDRILSLQEKGKLKVSASIFVSAGISPMGIIEIVRNNWLLFLLYTIIIGVLGSVLEPIFQYFFGTSSFGK